MDNQTTTPTSTPTPPTPAELPVDTPAKSPAESSAKSPSESPAKSPAELARLKKSRKRLAIILTVAILAIIAIAVAIILIIVNTNSRSDSSTGSGSSEDSVLIDNNATTSELATAFTSLDMSAENTQYYDIESALTSLLNSANIYVGCIGGDGSIDGTCVVNRIDLLASEYEITDSNQLFMLSLEKARALITAGDYVTAWNILESIDPDSLLANQLHLYYLVMYRYYRALGDETKMNEYRDLMWSVSVEELG